MKIWTTGNSAKQYCLNWIDEYVQNNQREISILDIGCGDGSNFLGLLKTYPALRYVGVEPREESYRQAIQLFGGMNATFFHTDGYNLGKKLNQQFDLIASFSTMEHVYRRADYLKSAEACLKRDGYILMNYDSGHFLLGGIRDRVKNLIGPLLAPLGAERYYQSFVSDEDIVKMIQAVGLQIIETKSFNSRLKDVAKSVPKPQREEFMTRWLALELWLNECGLAYSHARSSIFFTRNLILRHL